MKSRLRQLRTKKHRLSEGRFAEERGLAGSVSGGRLGVCLNRPKITFTLVASIGVHLVLARTCQKNCLGQDQETGILVTALQKSKTWLRTFLLGNWLPRHSEGEPQHGTLCSNSDTLKACFDAYSAQALLTPTEAGTHNYSECSS